MARLQPSIVELVLVLAASCTLMNCLTLVLLREHITRGLVTSEPLTYALKAIDLMHVVWVATGMLLTFPLVAYLIYVKRMPLPDGDTATQSTPADNDHND